MAANMKAVKLRIRSVQSTMQDVYKRQVYGHEGNEMVDGYRKKSDHADPVQLHAGDAASDVSGHLLAAVRESGTWRLDLYSGIFLWYGRLRNGSLETLYIRDRERKERGKEEADFL